MRRPQRNRSARKALTDTLACSLACALICSRAAAAESGAESDAHHARLVAYVEECRSNPGIVTSLSLRTRLERGDLSMGEAETALRAVGAFIGQLDPKATLRRYLDFLQAALDRDLQTVIDTSRPSSVRGMTIYGIGGEAPHPAFLPIMRELAFSAAEPAEVRIYAMKALSMVPHDEVIPELAALADVPEIRPHALSKLERLTGLVLTPTQLGEASVRHYYDAWWAEHKSEFKYDRTLATMEQ